MYAFVKNNNLYVAEAGEEDKALQLTQDGSEDYTFAGGAGFGGVNRVEKKDEQKDEKDQKDLDQLRDDKNKIGDDKKSVEDKGGKDAKAAKDKKVRAPVSWSKDSKAFYVLRRDARAVKELFLIDSVSQPRPALVKYKYAMPGEENIRKTELYVFHKDQNKLVKVDRVWKDEDYSDLHWGKTSDELRFVRGDRLHRNIEFCTFGTTSGAAKCLILEGFENSSIVSKPVKYLEDTDEMIWWSERSGWGHFYLYDRGGKLKNAITAGDYRAGAIVAVDPKQRLLYFHGNGREPGENVYFNHLYRVHLDGSGLDPAGSRRRRPRRRGCLRPIRLSSIISRVWTWSLSPCVRDARGNKIMDLEKADLAKLRSVGWKMPETFIAKAADGVTDLYGNLYKPFDFDPRKKYPIIAHVYPGPQTESTPHSFKPFSPQQQPGPARCHRHTSRQSWRALRSVPRPTRATATATCAIMRLCGQKTPPSSNWRPALTGSTSNASASTATRAAASCRRPPCSSSRTTSSSKWRYPRPATTTTTSTTTAGPNAITA